MEELQHDGEEGPELEFGIAYGGGVYEVGGKNEVTGDRGEEEGDHGDGCDDDDDDFRRRYHLDDFACYVIEEEEGSDDRKEGRSTAGVGIKGSRIIMGGGKSIRPGAPPEKKTEKKKTKAENVGEIVRARREEQRKRDIDSKRRVFRTGGLGTSAAVTSSSYSSSTTRGAGSSIMSDITSRGATVYHSAYSSEGGRMATAPAAAKKEMRIKVGAAATPGDNGNKITTKNAREIALVDALKTSATAATTTDPGKSRDAGVATPSKLPNRNTVREGRGQQQQPQQQQAVVLEQMEEGGGDDEELGDMKKEIGDPLAGNDNTTNKRSKILSYKNVKYDYYDFSTGTEYEGRTAMRCCVVLLALFCVVFGCILVFFVFEYETPEAA